MPAREWQRLAGLPHGLVSVAVESAQGQSRRLSPLVEELDDVRCRVTVAYRDDDGAEDVWVIGGLAGADPGDRRMRPAGDGWWERSYELERDVRTGYWFTTTLVPSGVNELIADPLNPRGHVYPANPDDPDDEAVTLSLIELPGAAPFRWSLPVEGVPRGEVATHRVSSRQLGNDRQVFTYTPAGYDAACAYPLVVAVLPDSLDSATRSRELRLYEPFVDFLVEELLPWTHERLSFESDPASTLVAGSSLGGLTAAFCGLRRPDQFGLVLSQSGAFQRGLPTEFADADRLPLRFALDVGVLETTPFERFASLYHANLHMRDVLVAKGYDVSFREFAGGHDYLWWRETIADGLIALLG
jgi:enterochelin esterase-like enzyme